MNRRLRRAPPSRTAPFRRARHRRDCCPTGSSFTFKPEFPSRLSCVSNVGAFAASLLRGRVQGRPRSPRRCFRLFFYPQGLGSSAANRHTGRTLRRSLGRHAPAVHHVFRLNSTPGFAEAFHPPRTARYRSAKMATLRLESSSAAAAGMATSSFPSFPSVPNRDLPPRSPRRFNSENTRATGVAATWRPTAPRDPAYGRRPSSPSSPPSPSRRRPRPP